MQGVVSPLDRETALGFTNTIMCVYANLWTQYFWESLCAGKTVSEACDEALDEVDEKFEEDYEEEKIDEETYLKGHGLDSYEIYGNGDLVLKEML